MTNSCSILIVPTPVVSTVVFSLSLAESTSLAEPTGELSGAVFALAKITPSGFGGYPPKRSPSNFTPMLPRHSDCVFVLTSSCRNHNPSVQS
jgi:hypothetical protein